MSKPPLQSGLSPTRNKLLAAIISAGVLGSAVIAIQSTTPALATNSNDSNHIQVFQSGFADLVEQVKPAVVNISTKSIAKGNLPDNGQYQFSNPRLRDFFGKQFKHMNPQRNSRSLGSGFIVDSEGFVVTNYHVVAKADEIDVILDDGTQLEASIVGSDPKTDLALLKVEHSKPLPEVKFGDDNLSRVGDWVIAIGNPFGLGGTTTTGIISARGRNINSGPFDDFIQIDAPINRGNSGGPLFNTRGEVIGVNSAIYSPSGGSVGIGFAIPSDLAANVIDELKDHGLVQRAWLGVQIQNVTADIAASLKMAEPKGALVADIVKNSPAENSKLKTGDVILEFDGHTIDEMRELPLVVAQSPIDKEIDLVVFRDGRKITLEVNLDSSKEERVAERVQDEKPTLGLALAPVNETTRRQLQLSKTTTGVVITDVSRNSPAAEKGIRPGDVIKSIGNNNVSTPEEVVSEVNSARDQERDAVLLKINRSGRDRFVALRIS